LITAQTYTHFFQPYPLRYQNLFKISPKELLPLTADDYLLTHKEFRSPVEVLSEKQKREALSCFKITTSQKEKKKKKEKENIQI